MAWRCIKVEEEREYLVKNYINKIATMRELCEECGVSRETGYKWVKRFLQYGKTGLTDQSRAPKKPARKFSEEQMKIALELKQKYSKYGPKKILALLKRHHPNIQWPSATRLYEVFKEYHLVSSRKLRRRVPRTHPLGTLNSSNDVWCADFKGWFITGSGEKIEPLTITDAFSRFAIECIHLQKKNTDEVWKVYSKAFYEYGLPLRMRTDNGPPFATTGVGRLSRLSVKLIQAGVTPEWITPGHPEENGRHERFHRSLKEAIASPPAETYLEQVNRLQLFKEEYNFDRPHESLNQETPGSCYEPSTRLWDGKLRSPEYNTKEMEVRKVVPSGCIYWKGMLSYLGQVLSGEYVGLQPIGNETYQVYYGPVYLGNLIENKGFFRPELPLKRRKMSGMWVNNVN